jgi:hypothetical protein
VRDFTLEDFDTHFGADIDSWDGVSLDDQYVTGECTMAAQSGGTASPVRATVQTVTGAAETGEELAYRRARVLDGGMPSSAGVTGGSLTYRRAAVETAQADAVTGEGTLSYIRRRNLVLLLAHCQSGQEIYLSFRGWAWSPYDAPQDTGLWIRETEQSGEWEREHGFSQFVEGGVGSR